MKTALTTVDNEEKKRARLLAAYKEKTFSDLTSEDKDHLLKFLFETSDLIKKS